MHQNRNKWKYGDLNKKNRVWGGGGGGRERELSSNPIMLNKSERRSVVIYITYHTEDG